MAGQLYDENDIAIHSRPRPALRDIALIASLGGIVVSRFLGFGLATAICHGILAASLGSPHRKATYWQAADDKVPVPPLVSATPLPENRY